MKWDPVVFMKRCRVLCCAHIGRRRLPGGGLIAKADNVPPVGEATFVTYEGLPSDHYLWLAGEIGKVYRGKRAANAETPERTKNPKKQPAGASRP